MTYHRNQQNVAIANVSRRGLLKGVAATGGLVLAGAGVTTAVLQSRGADDRTVFSCLESPGGSLFAATPDSDETPVERCAELWLDGTFGTDGAPPLVACVTSDDTVAVVPGGEGTCAMLGMALADSPGPGADRSDELVSMLSNTFGGTCLDAEQAEQAVRAVLTDLGLEADWRVDTSLTDDAPCHAPSVDGPSKTVWISPRAI